MESLRRVLARYDYKYLVAAAFIFGLFMEILDTTIVNVALPRLSEEFHADTAQLEWVVTGYLLSLAVWIPASGWIGDRFGTRRTFLFATGMFVLGSALCGAAWSITSLVVFRIIQGVGGGMMTPVGTAMLYRAFTPQERARASAVLSVPTMIAPMLGPVFGGFLVDQISWRWIFYVNLPIGVLSFLFSWAVLREHKEPGAGGFDPFGFLLSGAGLAGLLFALSRIASDGMAAPVVWATGLGSLACFAVLIQVERRVPSPILALALYARPLFRTASLTGFGTFSAQFGLIFLLPLYLQQMRGLTALESGLTTMPQPIAQILMVQVTSRMYSRLGPRINLITSSSGIILTGVLFLLTDLATDLWIIRGIMFLRGCFLAFMMVSLQTAAFSDVPRPLTGRAASLFSTVRQVAAAFGVAIAATVLTTQFNALAPAGSSLANPATWQAALSAFHAAIVVIIALGAVALFASFQVSDPRSQRGSRASSIDARRIAEGLPAVRTAG